MKYLIPLLMIIGTVNIKAQDIFYDLSTRVDPIILNDRIFISGGDWFRTYHDVDGDDIIDGEHIFEVRGVDNNSMLVSTFDNSALFHKNRNGEVSITQFNPEFNLEFQTISLKEISSSSVFQEQMNNVFGSISPNGKTAIINGHVFSIDKVNTFDFEITETDTIPVFKQSSSTDLKGFLINRQEEQKHYHFINNAGDRYTIIWIEINDPGYTEVHMVSNINDSGLWKTDYTQIPIPRSSMTGILAGVNFTKSLEIIELVGTNKTLQFNLENSWYALQNAEYNDTSYSSMNTFLTNAFSANDGAITYSKDRKLLFVGSKSDDIFYTNIDIYERVQTDDYKHLKTLLIYDENVDYDANPPLVTSLVYNDSLQILGINKRYYFESDSQNADYGLGSSIKGGETHYYKLDLDPPTIIEFVQIDDLIFNIEFSEQVGHLTYNNDYKFLGIPKVSDFEVYLDGIKSDENKLAIRSINGENDASSYDITFKTNDGPITGNISLGLADSNSIVDRSFNPVDIAEVSNEINIEDFNALGNVINVPNDFDLFSAIDYSGDNDSVLIAEGVYESDNLYIQNKNITITSDYNSVNNDQEIVINTILNGGITISGGNVIINGLSITNPDGTAIDANPTYNQGETYSLKVSNNNLFNSVLGVYANGDNDGVAEGKFDVTGNVIHGNGQGVEFRRVVSGIFSDNIVYNNKSEENGAGVFLIQTDILVSQNLIFNNTALFDRIGGGLLVNGFSTLLNNVIWGNKARRGEQIFNSAGLPFMDHSIVQNYGQKANVVAREGDNIYTEDPGIDVSYEPIASIEGKTVINRFGLYVSINDSSILYGNGRSSEFDKYITQTRVPIPFDSDADIGPFELEFAMMVNPIKATQLVYPLEFDENPGVDPVFEWEPVKYSTAYEVMISPKEDFSENVSTHKSDRHFMSLDNPLDSIHEKYYWKVRGINSTKKGDWSNAQMFNVGLINSNELIEEITEYQLSQNYPNPFNPSTQIHYALPEATHVTLEVFNSVGQKMMELVNGQKSAGLHTATFDASGLSSGVYLYKLTTPSFTQTKKMLLIK